jgi:hypothetical protein
MASGESSGTESASSRRASARSRSSSRRLAFGALIQNLAFVANAGRQLSRRAIEANEVDLQQRGRVLCCFFNIRPAAAVGSGAIYRQIDVRATGRIAARTRAKQNDPLNLGEYSQAVRKKTLRRFHAVIMEEVASQEKR